MTPTRAQLAPSTQAQILQALADARWPREARAQIASEFGATFDEVVVLSDANGFPSSKAMADAAARIRSQAATEHTHDTGQVQDDEYVEVPLRRLVPDPDNVRDQVGDVTELADSIRRMGMLQPIVARRRGDQLVVVMGHRRRAAALQAGLESVPVIISAIRADDVLVAMFMENTQREDLDPIEEARALAKIKGREEISDLELSRRVGKSQSHVSGRLALLELSPERQAAIRNGTLSIGRGTQLGRHHSGKERPNAWGKSSAAHLSFDHPLAAAVETLCRQLGHSKMTAGRIGGIGCGSCWEACIRSDERSKLERRRHPQTPADEPDEARTSGPSSAGPDIEPDEATA